LTTNNREKDANMTMNWKEIAQVALSGAEKDTMTFPEGVKLLMEAGFDGYAVDFRSSTRTYYLPNGETLELKTEPTSVPVSECFETDKVKEAIREAQTLVQGYTYKGFCDKVAEAGCAGYVVSFPGKRVLYYGRTAETHTEYFPGAHSAL
jgi:uncharacterized protein YbcV (DUF1398 family)